MKGQMAADSEARVVPIIEHMAAHAPVGDETTIRGFELPANQGVTHLIASVPLTTGSGLILHYTLKTASERIFMIASDGDAGEMGIILSAIECRDTTGEAPLLVSNVVHFDRPYLAERGVANGLICEPGFLKLFAAVKDHGAEPVMADTTFMLVLLLEDSDMVAIERDGALQLLANSERAERNWLAIPAKR